MSDPGGPKRNRGYVLPSKRLTRQELFEVREIEADLAEVIAQRPVTRGDCVGGERPCGWVSCRWHLYLDVSPATHSIKVNFPHLEVWEMPETCALDVADRAGKTLEEVGGVANLTRERIRQLEDETLARLRDAFPGLYRYLVG
jgi:hypothetical protein